MLASGQPKRRPPVWALKSTLVTTFEKFDFGESQ
jgi:hypothetical protein